MDSTKIEKDFMEMVAIASETGTEKENRMAEWMAGRLRRMACFKRRPDLTGLRPVAGDPFNRQVVWGLVEGEGRKTVVLLHHHDVVDARDYGALENLARDPRALAEALKGQVLEADVRRDLKSGEWVFGRGTADMKAGAAAQLAVLEEWSGRGDKSGNLLLLSVPDEETLSAGMREAASLMKDLARTHDLEYVLLIDSEPHDRETPERMAVHQGSVGKLMPMVYVRGVKAHLHDYANGANPLAFLAELAVLTEATGDLRESAGGQVSPPPAWIWLRDFKARYDASLPEAAGGLMSIHTLGKGPLEVLEFLAAAAEMASWAWEDRLDKRLRWSRKKDGQALFKVALYGELEKTIPREKRTAYAAQKAERLAAIRKRVEAGDELLSTAGFDLMRLALDWSPVTGPVAVIGLAPPFYPAFPPKKDPEGRRLVETVLSNLEWCAAGWAERVEVLDYFMGISDMSYGGAGGEGEAEALKAHMPLWGTAYRIPFEALARFDFPVLNIGPWGKDLHRNTERVRKEDLLVRTPLLLETAVEAALGKGRF